MINQGDSIATVKTKIADGLALKGVAAPTSWLDGTNKLNAQAVAYGLPVVEDQQLGNVARARINAILEALPFEVETQAFVARLDVPPTPERKNLINNVYVSLKAGGVLSKLEHLWLVGADVQTSTRNWVQDVYNLSAVNTPTFLADRYFQGDGSSSYLNSGFNLSGGTKFLLNSASLGIWSTVNAQGTAAECGTTNTIILVRNQTDTTLARVNTTNNITSATLNSIGMWQATRTAAGLQRLRKPDGSFVDSPAASTALDNETLRFLGRAGVNQFSNRPLAGGYFGGGLTNLEMGTINSTMTTYLTAIGAYTP